MRKSSYFSADQRYICAENDRICMEQLWNVDSYGEGLDLHGETRFPWSCRRFPRRNVALEATVHIVLNRANVQLRLGPFNEFGELTYTKLQHFAKM